MIQYEYIYIYIYGFEILKYHEISATLHVGDSKGAWISSCDKHPSPHRDQCCSWGLFTMTCRTNWWAQLGGAHPVESEKLIEITHSPAAVAHDQAVWSEAVLPPQPWLAQGCDFGELVSNCQRFNMFDGYIWYISWQQQLLVDHSWVFWGCWWRGHRWL